MERSNSRINLELEFYWNRRRRRKSGLAEKHRTLRVKSTDSVLIYVEMGKTSSTSETREHCSGLPGDLF